MTYSKLDKTPYIATITTQPIHIEKYVSDSKTPLLRMFARLVHMLAVKNVLNATMVHYIVEGSYIPGCSFADWNPHKEIEDGLPIQTIRGID